MAGAPYCVPGSTIQSALVARRSRKNGISPNDKNGVAEEYAKKPEI
jgi:hypothetical protein